ncbi:MAG: prepilin-type N-terminal cleavage/methylation domain-containing protein [Bdellovibrionales bacterium]|nr:prepilin-type N-terminal cleavage/methylation domain-containing protein [Bdellovibrionales bacterium]
MRNSKGFTLIQTLISMAILGSLSVGVLEVVNYSNNISTRQAYILNLQMFEHQAETIVGNSGVCSTLLLDKVMPTQDATSPLNLDPKLIDTSDVGNIKLDNLLISNVEVIGAGPIKKALMHFDVSKKGAKTDNNLQRRISYTFYFETDAEDKLVKCFAPDDPEVLEEEIKAELINETEGKLAIQEKMCFLFNGDWVDGECNDVNTPQVIKDQNPNKPKKKVSLVEIARGHCRTATPEYEIEGWIERHDPTPNNTSNQDHYWLSRARVKNLSNGKSCISRWDTKGTDTRMVSGGAGCTPPDHDQEVKLQIVEAKRDSDMIVVFGEIDNIVRDKSLVTCTSKISTEINFTNPGNEVEIYEGSCSKNDGVHNITATLERHDPTPEDKSYEDHVYVAKVNGTRLKTSLNRDCNSKWRTVTNTSAAKNGVSGCRFGESEYLTDVRYFEEDGIPKMKAFIYDEGSSNKEDDALITCIKVLAKKDDPISQAAACSQQGGVYTDGKCTGINTFKEVASCTGTNNGITVTASVELHDPSPDNITNKDHHYIAKVNATNTTKGKSCNSDWSAEGADNKARNSISECSIHYTIGYDNVLVRIDNLSSRPSKIEALVYDADWGSPNDHKVSCSSDFTH